MPLVLVDRPGGVFWRTWDRHLREHLLRNELISPDDLNLYQITDDPAQAVQWIARFYRNYHSSRFVKDLLVIRLQHAPSRTAIAALNEDFAGIITGAKVRLVDPLPEEIEDGEHLELPRLAFGFDRKSYGRLRELVDRLNGL
jgi:hypothetical protein